MFLINVKQKLSRAAHSGLGLFDSVRATPRWLPILSGVTVAVLLASTLALVARNIPPNNAQANALPAVLSADQSTATPVPAKPTVAATKPPAKPKARGARPTLTPLPIMATAQAQINLMAAQPTSEACPNPVGQVVTETIQSDVVGGQMPVQVFLPPCYRPNQFQYPALYLLQGNNHELGGWIDIGVTRIANLHMSLGVIAPFIIVMPANGQYGRNPYTWSWKGAKSYEGFVMGELVPMIDAKFSTIKSREARAIGGISRGGYWSIEVAFANPNTFGILGAHSPSITDKLIGAPANFTMLSYAKTITDVSTLRIWIDAGSTDWAQKDAKKLASDLENIKVPYQITFGEGPHDDPTWAARVPDYLAFYSSTWQKEPKPIP